MPQSDEQDPVWSVYDTLRTVRLNEKYYCSRMQRLERLNLCIELILAGTAPTSAIAGLWFLTSDIGATLWKVCGAIAAVVAIVKPALTLPKKIKELEGAALGYRGLDLDLMEIKQLIEQKRHYDAALQGQFKRAIDRLKILIGRTPLGPPNKKLLARCKADVDRELPSDRFFVPRKIE